MAKPKTAAISVRITPALKKALDAAAKVERRSVASYVQLLIEDAVFKRQPPHITGSGQKFGRSP